jgi:hypothetical protein
VGEQLVFFLGQHGFSSLLAQEFCLISRDTTSCSPPSYAVQTLTL